MLTAETITRQVVSRITVKANNGDIRPVLRNLPWPVTIERRADLEFLGRRIAAELCPKNRRPTLSFMTKSAMPIIDPHLAEHLFTWRPAEVADKTVDRWSPEFVIAATVVNALCAAAPEWCQALQRGTVRCEVGTDDETVTVALSFKRPLHPRKLIPNLAN